MAVCSWLGCLTTRTNSTEKGVSPEGDSSRCCSGTELSAAEPRLEDSTPLCSKRTRTQSSGDDARGDGLDTLSELWEDSQPELSVCWCPPLGARLGKSTELCTLKPSTTGLLPLPPIYAPAKCCHRSGDLQGGGQVDGDDQLSDGSSDWEERLIRFQEETTVWERCGFLPLQGRQRSFSAAGDWRMDRYQSSSQSSEYRPVSLFGLSASMFRATRKNLWNLEIQRRAVSDCTEQSRRIMVLTRKEGRGQLSHRVCHTVLVATFEKPCISKDILPGNRGLKVSGNRSHAPPHIAGRNSTDLHTVKSAKIIRNVSTEDELMLMAKDFPLWGRNKDQMCSSLPFPTARGHSSAGPGSGAILSHSTKHRRMQPPPSISSPLAPLAQFHNVLINTCRRPLEPNRHGYRYRNENALVAIRTAFSVVNFIVALLVRLRRRRNQ